MNTRWKKNDFERVEGREIIRAGNRNKAKKEKKIDIVNKKEVREQSGVRKGKSIEWIFKKFWF